MDFTPRLQLMNWLVSQGLAGLPENPDIVSDQVVSGRYERYLATWAAKPLIHINALGPDLVSEL
jgi:hypothetical protein